MIFPVLYAVLTWYLATIWRRGWRSVAAVAASVALLLVLDHYAKHAESRSTAGSVFHSELIVALLRPYTALVGFIGLFICVMPRRAPSEAHCQTCHYDLVGLDPRGLVCPECGEPFAYCCLACGHHFAQADPRALTCPDCSTRWRGPGSRAAPGEVFIPAADATPRPPAASAQAVPR